MNTKFLVFATSLVVMLLVFCAINYVREEPQLLMYANIFMSFTTSFILAVVLPRMIEGQSG